MKRTVLSAVAHVAVRIAAVAVAVAVALAVASCTIPLAETRLVAILPPLPDAWVEAWGHAGYEVFVRSPGSTLTSVAHALPDSRVLIQVPRDAPVVVVAEPQWQTKGPALASGERLEVAAAIWPFQLESSGERAALPLAFENGPAARILLRLMDAGVDLSTFNTRRFALETVDVVRGGAAAIDEDRIVAAIGSRSMRASYIRAPETREYEVDLAAGVWLRSSPFAPPLVGGGGVRVGLAQGLTPFYSDAGERILAAVDESWRVRVYGQ